MNTIQKAGKYILHIVTVAIIQALVVFGGLIALKGSEKESDQILISDSLIVFFLISLIIQLFLLFKAGKYMSKTFSLDPEDDQSQNEFLTTKERLNKMIQEAKQS